QRPGFNHPTYTHSFATFVRVTDAADRAGLHDLECVTISWFPADGEVHLHRLHPECGRNLGLHKTLQLMLCSGDRVSLWGPYAIDPELYERACAQRAYLESGAVRYKAVDSLYPSARVSNCIHALGDLGKETASLRITSTGWGEPASYYIGLRLRPWIINP